MNRNGRFAWQIGTLAATFAVATACGGSPSAKTPGTEQESAAEGKSVEPVELVFHSNNGDSPEAFDSLFGDALRSKFPNYTIKYFQSKKGQTLPELLAEKQRIDILFASTPYIFGLAMDADLQYDMSELIRTSKLNLNQFEPTLIDGIKLAGDGKLYALPVTNMVQVVFYNKRIFDQFGVSYPKDGMTWDETAEIARRLNRKEGEKQYLGFAASPAHILRGNQLSEPYLDPATEKPTFRNDVWGRLIDTYFVQPVDEGYRARVGEWKRLPNRKDFTDTQELAMFAFNSQFPFTVPQEVEKVDWDLVALPTFKEKPRVGSAATPFAMAITSMAKDKEAAMKAIDFLTSKEVQEQYSGRGIMPVIRDAAIKQAYGTKSEFAQKNWPAVFYNEYAPMAKLSRYHLRIETILNGVPTEAVRGTRDLNTALREAAERAEAAIAEEKRR
ncbi:extracellular solute-binding protein [Paenibacillus hemerocallicola]|uniref:Extracellular solute-binding protein n=1 Tax=Paenibacillus hemerocallicola TaxID=1172614 RepID=A0A5C4TCP6_9BACL|nr:extracellular solute-binding protein [Paenibacillus hemerocallicola]TNJ66642.1 extracellular solute-binding protein [Paenibacillus hemerocallicola]